MLASEAITAATLVEPRPAFTLDDPGYGALSDTKLHRDITLADDPRNPADISDFISGQLGSAVALPSAVRPMDEFIGMVPDSRIPAQVRRIAAQPVAAAMRDFRQRKGRAAMHRPTNDSMRKGLGTLPEPAFDAPIPAPVCCEWPQHTFVANEWDGDFQKKTRGLTCGNAAAARIAMRTPAVIVSAAPALSYVRFGTTNHGTSAGGFYDFR